MTTKKLVSTALLAALTCVATMIIKIPSPLNGYINLGDGIVLLAGWLLSPWLGFLAAGLGSALADILSGYIIYGPATFLIKGLMALVAYYAVKLFPRKHHTLSARIVSAIAAEILMIAGYFLFAGFLYGFGAAAMNIPANAVQGVAGIVIATVLMNIFDKNKSLRP